ncbi:MAG: hypothetical protein IKP03_01925 [Fibrobacter sp.]|nr:hypothetical protein [Fibrobacter sp.]
MKFFKNVINILCLASIIPFCACSDESPFEVAEDEIANASDDVYDAKRKSMCFNGKDEYNSWCCEMFGEKCSVKYSSSSSYVSESEKCRLGTSTYGASYCCDYYGYQCQYTYYSSSSYVSESEKCRLGTSTYSNSYCCSYYGYQCSYSSSSSRYTSSSSSAVYYLTTAKSMKVTLTYYKQLSSNWDGLDNAGDPEVSFTIYTYSDGVLGQTINTTTFIDKQDTRLWSGTVTKSYTINKGTDQIKICPKVIDEDISEHDNYSSGKCFTKSNIGYLKSTDVMEHEDYNSNYDLEWEWYLL